MIAPDPQPKVSNKVMEVEDVMGRIDLQDKLLERFENMERGAEAAAKSHGKSGNDSNYTFHSGRSKAFADCIRELKKAMKEAE